MKQGSISLFFLVSLLFFAETLSAQTSGGDASSWFIYALLAVVVLLFFMIVIQVSDNLLGIEAKRLGIDDQIEKSSALPSLSSLLAGKKPAHVGDAPVHQLKRGFDIHLEGAAEPVVTPADQVTTFGVQPANFIGIAPIPKVVVEEGQNVKAGDHLFFDKGRPEVKYVAPVSGEVIAVNRGAKRSIAEVVILADKEQTYRKLEAPKLDSVSREELVAFLLDSGAWPMIRQRPYDVVADPADTPRDIYISTFDTAPLAPDQNLIVDGRDEEFQKGLDVLAMLTAGRVHLGLDGRKGAQVHPAFAQAEGARKHWFSGKHPAGNVGVQIHNTLPLASNEKVWVLGVQEVITIGALFTQQRFNAERVVALTGAELEKPRYVRTYQGARLSELLKDNLRHDHVRIVSGDVLSGKAKAPESFLNYYDDQVTVLEEGDSFELFGWLIPGKLRPSVSRTYPTFLFPDLQFKADTNTHGEKRAFVVTGQYEDLLPMDIYVQHLMKSILIGDVERMEGLGIHELVEEDIALCEFACTSKQPLQQILREGLEKMRVEG